MKKLVVFLVALLLVQAALAKKQKKSSSSSSSEEHKKSKKQPSKVVTCPPCPKPKLTIAKQATVCEKEGRQIRCPAGSSIRVLQSFYGRRSPYVCPGSNVDDVNCNYGNSLAITKARCDGTEICNLTTANNWMLPDPCSNTSKYLEVTWICEPKNRRL